MSEFVERNRRAWDEVHRRRAEVTSGRLGMPEWVRARLPDVAGKRVLHLQCATGDETLDLRRLGAAVTAVDVSEEALAVARSRDGGVEWLRGDVHDLPAELCRSDFDVVFTGGGVLTWLHDLDAWAAGIAAALRPAGRLLLYDGHPVVQCLDRDLRWVGDYFDESAETSVGWAHFELPGEPAREEKQERFWRLAQVVTALAAAGLRIDLLEEVPADEEWRIRDGRVPGGFLLLATRP